LTINDRHRFEQELSQKERKIDQTKNSEGSDCRWRPLSQICFSEHGWHAQPPGTFAGRPPRFCRGAGSRQKAPPMQLHRHNQLRALATQVHSFSSTEPVSHTRDVTAMQDTITKIVEEEKILNARIDRLVDAKLEIREVIDLVEDVTLRLILEKRYLLFQPWEEIAIDLGITSHWAKNRHKEALKVVDRILEEHPYFFEKGVLVTT